MIKVSDEEIKEIIKKKNDKIEFISSKMIVKGNKHRRLVTMKCECGENLENVQSRFQQKFLSYKAKMAKCLYFMYLCGEINTLYYSLHFYA